MLAGDRDACRVNDMRLDAVSSEPARQPEAIAAGFEGDGNARDRAAGLAGLLTPAVEELEEGVLVRSKLFERMTRDPRNNPRHQPTGLAHLDDGDPEGQGIGSSRLVWAWGNSITDPATMVPSPRRLPHSIFIWPLIPAPARSSRPS